MKSVKKNYDVIIIGAGPAGLSVGSELSKKLNVIVIDRKKKLDETKRSWFIPKFAMELGKAQDIEDYTYPGVKRFLADTFSGVKDKAWKATLKGGYLNIKEHEILSYWGEKIEKNDSDILLNTSYLDHKIDKNNDKTPVTVHTNKGDYTAKLLIDASGYDSMILKKYHMSLDEDYYWWSVYGGIVKHKNGVPKDMQVGDYMFWQTFKNTNPNLEESLYDGRPVFEYEVLNEDTSFPLILFLRKEMISRKNMEATFNEVMKEEKVASKYKDIEIVEEKYGWYPSGDISQYIAKDHVSFVGDAACWTTPCGWGFAFIIKNYKRYAKNIIDIFQDGNFDEDTLEDAIDLDLDDKLQILFNKMATRILSLGDVETLDKIILLFDNLGFIYCEKTFTLTISRKDIKDIIIKLIKELKFDIIKKIFKKEDLKLILTEIDEITDEIRDSVVGFIKRISDKE